MKNKISQGFTLSEALTTTRSFNDSIGIMLRSYTRAINEQKGLSGSLFRRKTKADCVNCPNLSQTFTQSEGLTAHLTEKQYPQVCFNYIHQNPVKAKIVTNEVDYEFSSAKDYANIRKGKLVNKEIAFEYIDYKELYILN
jgi:putative transposase